MNEETKKHAPAYWIWDKSVPTELCQLALKEFETIQFEEARLGLDSKPVLNHNFRKGKVSFLPPHHWLQSVLSQYVIYANNASGWNFVIQDFENVQIALYEKDGLYDWHPDDDILNRSKPMQRKLTVVCQLSKAEDFEDGGLFIKGIDTNLLKNQGDVAVFPSYMVHKAATVTSGKRVTAVCWSVGDYFK